MSKNLFLSLIDLVDFYEMLQLPSERQHYKTGCSLVYSVFWVRVFYFFYISSSTASTLLYIIIVCFPHVQ